jgi:1-acyl-sn-glycerol-3-phosphate acyltransferase
MAAFKKGAYQMALDLKYPIIPVTINGSYDIMPANSYLINPHKMEMIIHDPICIDEIQPGNLREVAIKTRELANRSQDIIESGLWRKYKKVTGDE